jgi:soluble lytic murein transglycosylase-like protein
MRERRSLTVFLALLAVLCLSSGGVPPAAFEHPESGALAADAPWTPEVPAIEQGLDELGTLLLPSERSRVARAIAQEARRAGFSPEFVLAVIRIESAGDPFAMSSKGAVGLMQLRPRTAEFVARTLGVRWSGPETLLDPVVNVRLGVAYLEHLRARYGNLAIALAAYNWGPTRISEMLRRSQPIPVGYSQRVLEACRGHAVAVGRPA